MIETPLRGDYNFIVPLPEHPDGYLLPRLRLVLGDLLRAAGLDGELLVDFQVNAPPELPPLELGLRAVGVADLKARWARPRRSEGVLFEAAFFPRGRSIPLCAGVVGVSVARDDAVVPLDADARARLGGLTGDALTALRSAPKSLRSLRGLRGERPASRPGVAIAAFADLGPRLSADLRGDYGELACYFHLPRDRDRVSLFTAIPEGPMPGPAVDALSAIVSGLIDRDAAALHSTLGPAPSLIWGFHASAPLVEVVGAFERDGFDIRPLPRLAGDL